QAPIDVGRHDLEILRCHAGRAHVTSHLLALEDLARILALAGRTMRAVRNRVTMRRAPTTDIVALHDALKTLTDRGSRHVDLQTDDERHSADLGTDTKQVLRRNSELGQLGLRLNGSGGKMAAHRLRRVLHLRQANAELNGGVAILLLRALS